MVDDIQAGLIELDIARSIFASYCGIPATRLGLYLDGAKTWDFADLGACHKTLRDLKGLAGSVAPVPVDWRKVGAVRIALDARKKQMTFVVSTTSGCFSHLNRNYVPQFSEAGTALDGEAAHGVCTELRKLNFQSVKAVQRELQIGEEPINGFFSAWKPR